MWGTLLPLQWLEAGILVRAFNDAELGTPIPPTYWESIMEIHSRKWKKTGHLCQGLWYRSRCCHVGLRRGKWRKQRPCGPLSSDPVGLQTNRPQREKQIYFCFHLHLSRLEGRRNLRENMNKLSCWLMFASTEIKWKSTLTIWLPTHRSRFLYHGRTLWLSVGIHSSTNIYQAPTMCQAPLYML